MRFNQNTSLSGWITLVLIFLTPFGRLWAEELQVASVFSDHAVLQQGVPLPIWGKAAPEATVTVEFSGQKHEAVADSDGLWKLKLNPLKLSLKGAPIVIRSGERSLEILDVLVGEVWYASGQSNMQMNLKACVKGQPSLEAVRADPKVRTIRTLRIEDPDAEDPVLFRNVKTTWQLDLPEKRGSQSAVAFFFARRLHDDLGVPIGIIEGSWGGKPIEGFIPRSHFANDPVLKPVLDLAEAEEFEKLKVLEGGVIIRNTAGRPGRIYNARVAPIAPFPIKGVIWYQGESNAGNGEDPRNYRFKMRALIQGWRTAWSNPELPFYSVQLPAFRAESVGWIRLREEQRRSLGLIPNTGMAVTIDLRDQNIHPSNKVDVGERLARWAISKDYGKDMPFSGPLFKSAQVVGPEIHVRFDHAKGGLMLGRKEGLEPVVELTEGSVAHLEICDETGIWREAKGVIDGEQLKVRSESIKNPVAVRYACQGAPENANLYNRAGLPASPFCSNLEFLPWSSKAESAR